MTTKYWSLLRLSLGFLLFWAFLDKLFGLGFNTTGDKSWLAGNSPTLGYLKFATSGPLAGTFQALAGNIFVDWLFMLGLLLIGLSLLLGIGVKIAGYSGALMMLLLWLSAFPPEHNPLLDEHIIYLIALLSFTKGHPGHRLGWGERWSKTELVKKYPILE